MTTLVSLPAWVLVLVTLAVGALVAIGASVPTASAATTSTHTGSDTRVVIVCAPLGVGRPRHPSTATCSRRTDGNAPAQ